jgi:hypothetical protein
MNFRIRNVVLRTATISLFAFGLLSPSGVLAAEGSAGSTGTLVGTVTCGADEITPAGNAVVSVAAFNVETRTGSGGRFTLTDVPAGQRIRIDAATDKQQSSMSSRYDLVTEPGQTLDIGSIDLAVCPSPNTAPVVTTEQEMEQRGNPND